MLALIDLDGTLVDRDAGFMVWAEQLALEHQLSAEDLAWIHRAEQAVKERGAFVAQLTARYQQLGLAEALWADYRRCMPELAPAFPGVVQALSALKAARWRLGVLTNGKVDNQTGKLRRTGLLELVDGVCISEEAGLRKPDRAIFDLARQRSDVEQHEQQEPRGVCWMVGDDPVLDIAGGAGAGMNTLWVSHGRPWTADIPSPDRQAPTPAEALPLLLAPPDTP